MRSYQFGRQSVLSRLIFPVMLAGLCGHASAQDPATAALINEYQPNPNGADPNPQSIEISGPASTEATLWVLLIEMDEGSGPGTIDEAIQFTVNFDANGLAVVSVPDLENPSNVLVIVDEFTGATGADLDTNDDGAIDVALPWTTVLDAISVPDDGSDALLGEEFVTSLGTGSAFAYTGDEPQLVFRDGMTGDWYAINDPDLGAAYNLAAENVLESGAMAFDADQTATTFGAANPSLTENVAPPQLTLTLDPRQISEEAEFTIFGSVTRPLGLATGDVTIDLAISSGDASRVELSVASVTLLDGEDFGDFEIDPVANTDIDGNEVLTVSATATGYATGETTFVVMDDETPFPTLVINEVLADSAQSGGPDYIELYNAGGSAVDIGGYKVVSYQADPDFSLGTLDETIEIPASTMLEPGAFFLIGASDAEDADSVGQVYGVTPDLIVPDLNLDDFDFSISLLDASDMPVFSALLQDADFDAIANIAGVQVPANIVAGPEETFGATGYYLLTDGGSDYGFLEFTGSTEKARSGTPGATNMLSDQLFVEADVTQIGEDAGADSVSFTVTRFPSANTSGNLVVNLASDDTDELTVPSTVTILDGETEAMFFGTPQTDSVIDGDKSVTITVSATDYVSGTVGVEVVDVDLPVLASALLNEYQPNPNGADPVDTVFEVSGTPSSIGSLWVLSVDLDSTSLGVIDFAQQFSAAFDANGLALLTVPSFDLENPSHAIVLVDEFTGSQGDDLDANDDGSIDGPAPWGSLLDALSVPDDLTDAAVGVSFISSIGGGSAFSFTGGEPQLVFRDGTSGDWYAINDPDNGEAFGLNATNVLAGGSFDADQTQTTFGFVNPSLTAGTNTFDNWIAGFGGVTDSSAEGTNDNDGANVLDAFFGTDPTVDDANGISSLGGSGNTFTFRHKLAKAPLSDVNGVYEWSTTLTGDWNGDGVADSGSTVSFEVTGVVDSSNTEFNIVEVIATVTGDELEELFVRLSVSAAEIPQ